MKVIQMGAAERSWGDTKNIMTNQQAKLNSDKTEKLAIISTSSKLSNARTERVVLEKAEADTKRALWGDEDERFDLQLEQFGIDVEEVKKKEEAPKRMFRCWIEEWEKPILKKNDAVAKMKLLTKYGGLVFKDIDDGIVYTISTERMQYHKGKDGGWCVLAEPPDYDGDNHDMLKPYMINDDTLIYLIRNTEQPKKLNVELIEVEV